MNKYAKDMTPEQERQAYAEIQERMIGIEKRLQECLDLALVNSDENVA